MTALHLLKAPHTVHNQQYTTSIHEQQLVEFDKSCVNNVYNDARSLTLYVSFIYPINI